MKALTALFALTLPLSAQYYKAAASRDYLCIQTNPAAAYAVGAVISPIYKTKCVEVRDSGGQTATTDYSAAAVADGRLTAAIGGTDNGLVRTWYDGSRNGNNATQTTDANQPKIVSAGALVLENGVASMDFDGVNDSFSLASNISESTTWECYLVTRPKNAANSYTMGFGESAQAGLYPISLQSSLVYNWGVAGYQTFDSAPLTTTTAHVVTSYGDAGQNARVDMINLTKTAFTANTLGTNYNRIGMRGAASFGLMELQELTLYKAIKTADRAVIEFDLADRYNITFPLPSHTWKVHFDANTGVFTDAGTTPATDGQTVQQWNDQSGNANHATQATAGDRPTLDVDGLDGKRTLVFDLTSTDTTSMDLTSSIDYTVAGPMAMFVVGKRIDSGGSSKYWMPLAAANRDWDGQPLKWRNSTATFYVACRGNGYSTTGGNTTRGGLVLISMWGDTNKLNIRLNGVQQPEMTVFNNGFGTGELMTKLAFYLKGTMSELLYTEDLLTTDQVRAVEAHLSQKWGVPSIDL